MSCSRRLSATQYGQDLRIRAMAVDSGYLPMRCSSTRARARRAACSQSAALAIRKADPAQAEQGGLQAQRRGAETRRRAVAGADGHRQARSFRARRGDKCIDPQERLLRFCAELEDEYYRQLCAEVWDPHKRKWVKVHTRNEGLDITVYATAPRITRSSTAACTRSRIRCGKSSRRCSSRKRAASSRPAMCPRAAEASPGQQTQQASRSSRRAALDAPRPDWLKRGN
jgi:phage terminase large subunit GpA-like protein